MFSDQNRAKFFRFQRQSPVLNGSIGRRRFILARFGRSLNRPDATLLHASHVENVSHDVTSVKHDPVHNAIHNALKILS